MIWKLRRQNTTTHTILTKWWKNLTNDHLLTIFCLRKIRNLVKELVLLNLHTNHLTRHTLQRKIRLVKIKASLLQTHLARAKLNKWNLRSQSLTQGKKYQIFRLRPLLMVRHYNKLNQLAETRIATRFRHQ